MSKDRLDILRDADAIYLDQIKKHGLYNKIWQAFAVILPVQTVGVMGDERTYENVLALRAVTSTDGMTADSILTHTSSSAKPPRASSMKCAASTAWFMTSRRSLLGRLSGSNISNCVSRIDPVNQF